MLFSVLSPKKESKYKIPKSEKEIKDQFLDSIPKIINNKIHSYILMQVRIYIKDLYNVHLILYLIID